MKEQICGLFFRVDFYLIVDIFYRPFLLFYIRKYHFNSCTKTHTL